MDSCNGLTLHMRSRDYFLPCTQTRKTAKLVREVAEAIFSHLGIGEAPNASTLDYIRERLYPAQLVHHESQTQGTWYSIHTENSCSSGLVEGRDVTFLTLKSRL